MAQTRCHFISCAVFRARKRGDRWEHEVSPRGVRVSDAVVFPGTAAQHPQLRAWLERDCIKAVHNLGVDAHTLQNEGVFLNGGVNTLALARWAWPARARMEGFTLDSLARDFLGVGKTEQYEELFTTEVTECKVRTRKVKLCECGERPTRGHPRGSTPGHARFEGHEETRIPRQVKLEVPLREVVPGHALFDRAGRYAAQDAVLGLGIYELATREIERRKVDVPWA